MTAPAALLGIALALAVIRALQSPRVRVALAAMAGAVAALGIAEGYAVAVLALAALGTAGTLGTVAILHRRVVPAAARGAWGMS